MSSLTTNYSLSKPAAGTPSWDALINTNMDIIDGVMARILEKQRQADAYVQDVSNTPAYRGYNMGFDFWQRGVSFTADGFTADQWEMVNETGTIGISRVSGDANFNSKYNLRVTGDNGESCGIWNYIPYKPTHNTFYKYCADRPCTFAIDIKKSTAGDTVNVRIYDGVDTQTVATASSTAVQRIVVNHTVNANPTTLVVKVDVAFGATGTVDIGNAAFSLGTFLTLPYIPLTPSKDALGCFAQYQKLSFSIGWYNRTATVTMKKAMMYLCPMIGTPTATVSGGNLTGTFSTLDFVPVNELIGYIHAIGATKSGNNVGVYDKILELEVT